MSQEMFEELSIAFQRNKLRYHILKNQLTWIKPSFWGLFLYL
jgi:hypothetical protein